MTQFAHDVDSNDRVSIIQPVRMLVEPATSVVPAMKYWNMTKVPFPSNCYPKESNWSNSLKLLVAPPSPSFLDLERLRSKGGTWTWMWDSTNSISFSSGPSWIVVMLHYGL